MSFAPAPTISPTPDVIWYGMGIFGSYAAHVAESQAAPASATCNAINEALYFPFVVTTTKTFSHCFWFVGTAVSGTSQCSMGIYDEAGTRLAVTANTTLAGASVIQTAAFTAAATLTPGVYYYAIEFTEADVNGIFAYSASLNRGKCAGFYRQAVGANPLPANATFATWTSQVVPVCGISVRAI